MTTLEGNAAAALAVQTDVANEDANEDILALDFVLTDDDVAVANVATLQTTVTGSITATITESTGATLTDGEGVSLLSGTGHAFTINISKPMIF